MWYDKLIKRGVKMNRKKLITGLVFAVLLATYLTVLFLVKKVFDTSFWVSFGFILASFIMVIVSFMFVANENRKRQVVGMPVTVLSCLYFAVEFVLGTIFMFFTLDFVPVFIPQFVLFALFLVCYIPAILSDKNYKQDNNQN